MKTITVFVITYNQEDVIHRAMDSILSQKDWGLHQVIIGDDCSKDRTYEILQEYQQKYPDIVRPYRNEKNMGIYGNLQNLIQYREDTDLYTSCSGDDAFCEGYFKSLQDFIEKNDIPVSEDIGIMSDWKIVDPLGKELIRRNNILLKDYRLWGLKMRGQIGRSLVYTKSVIDQFKPVILDRGLRLAETLYDSQPYRIIKKMYYMPKVTSIYYTGIGVSTTLSKTGYATTENIVKWQYLLENLITDKRDVNYAKYQISRSKFLLEHRLSNYLRTIWYCLRGVYPRTLKNYKEAIGVVYYLKRNN